MRVSDFDYELPTELIAQYPAPERTGSRLLHLEAESGRREDRYFTDLAELLDPGDVLVFNDTRVLRARLHARKRSGGRVELLVERVLDPGRVLAHVRASKSPRAGSILDLDAGAQVVVSARRGELYELCFPEGVTAAQVLEQCGEIPLPPYIRRPPEALDVERYQTVYARREGAVAAPTAGLHFDTALLARLEAAGVQQAWVTLHVGAGTFQPVRAERVEEHSIHRERAELSAAACARIGAARAQGRRVIAVGTTCVRVLESACSAQGLRPFSGETGLFIYPGYRFRCVDAIITNFHLPRSTLLMLVAAFADREQVLAAYHHAVRERYRFYSYGDAMLIARRAAAGAGDRGCARRPRR